MDSGNCNYGGDPSESISLIKTYIAVLKSRKNLNTNL